jgi:hypothetical protein
MYALGAASGDAFIIIRRAYGDRRVRTNLDSCEAEDCGFTEEKQTKDAVAMQISPISAKPLPKPRAPASATPPHRVAPQDRFSADCRALQTEPQGTASACSVGM